MSGTLVESPPPSSPSEPPVQPELALLEDRVPPALKRSRRLAGCVAGFGLIFAWFVLQPLWHTDLWGHLAYGRWLAVQRTLPPTEPLMPLARGVPFVDTAWLSQLIGYFTIQNLGVAGLQGLFALTITATTIVLFLRIQEKTRSTGLGWLGVGTFLWLNWGLLATVRPQLAGLLCFVILLHRLTSRRFTPWDVLGIPVLIALWANLHGSFVVGLALIATFVAGRAIDLVRRTGTLRSLFHDSVMRQLIIVLQLSAAAVLFNPYGLGLYAEVLMISRNLNLRSLTEWQPLDVRGLHGQIFAASAVVLIILYRLTPRRVAGWEALLLLGLGCATLTSSRFAIWWGPVAALMFCIHLHAVLRRWLPWRAALPASPVSGKWSVVAVGIAWIVFAYSPPGMRLLHHKEPDLAKATSNDTPLGVVAWLNEHPPQGLIFNPYEWGDYLLWAGPKDLQVFLNSHAHLVPREVWQHYLLVTEQTAEWSQTLDRYGINTVVLDTRYRSGLIRRMKEDPAWTVGYEDNRGAVLLRRTPI